MIKKNKILIFFLLWSLWISAEFLLGPYSHVRIFDNGDSLLPQLIASKIQFQKYGINYFASYMVSGVDAAAQGLAPFSNLISVLFILFPSWLAYGVLMYVQRFLAGYFTYRLARDSLKINTQPAVIAGLLFSLLNFSIASFTIYHAFGLPALPFIIWVLEKINREKIPKNYIYLMLFGLLVGWANYFVYFSPYILPFIFLWFILIKNRYQPKSVINLVIFSLFSIIPMVPNILSVLLNSGASQRTIFNLQSATFYHQGKYLTAFYTVLDIAKSYWPSLLIVALLIVKFKVKDKFSKKLLITLLLLILAIFSYKLFEPFLSNFPGLIKSFSFDRLEFIIPFMLAITAAYYINLLTKRSRRFVSILVFIIITVLFFKVKLDTLKNYAPFRSLYEHPDLVDLSWNIDSSKWRVATITGGGVRPAYALADGLNTVDAYLTLYPLNYYKFWSSVIAKRIKGDKSRYEDFIDWGNRVYLYGPENFDGLEKIDFEKYYDLDLLSHANVKYIISTKPVSDPNLFLLSSAYRRKLNGWENWRLVDKIKFFISGKFYGRPLYIYENAKALPRFYLEKNGAVSANSVKVLSYLPDKIELSTDALQDSKLVIAINYYKYWRFMINGIRTIPEKYLGTFMSVNLPKGENKILIQYKPPYKIF